MHLSAALFLHSSKTDMVLVPIKGGGPAMIDIIGGHTQLAVGSVVAAMPHLKSGKLPLGLQQRGLLPKSRGADQPA